jgi:predicted GIY-YIG superfamily endonuclease
MDSLCPCRSAQRFAGTSRNVLRVGSHGGHKVIVERPTTKGVMRYLVRVSRKGERTCLGTYDTRAEAEQVEREAGATKPRKCLGCFKEFTPQTKNGRRARCSVCIDRQRAKQEKNDDHWVYVCQDWKGDLLYVGITSSGIKRFKAHGDVQGWWSSVVNIRLHHFDNRKDAEWAEAKMIQDLRPPHNVQHTTAPPNNVIQFPGAESA